MHRAGIRARATPHPQRAPRVVARSASRIAVVLGGGGLKGFAHIGVLRALRERGIRPHLLAGSSIGALLGAATASGVRWEELAARAEALQKRDLFRLNHYAMLMERVRAPSLYSAEPLRALVASVVPEGTFDALATPMLVNTVDVARGTQVVWGAPGLRDVSVREAVYASCALPGFFPPAAIAGRVCVDGGTVDNMPVSIAALGADGRPVDAIIAVDVGNADLTHMDTIQQAGFASIFMRSASVMMHALQEPPLAGWEGPPMLLVRPRVSHIGWFAFGNARVLIEEGYRAACEALRDLDAVLTAPSGIYPRRPVRVTVDREKCTGCGLCVARAPRSMGRGADGKAYALTRECSWSPADGTFVKHCPVHAISVEVVDVRVVAPAAVAMPAALRLAAGDDGSVAASVASGLVATAALGTPPTLGGAAVGAATLTGEASDPSAAIGAVASALAGVQDTGRSLEPQQSAATSEDRGASSVATGASIVDAAPPCAGELPRVT